MLNPLSRVRCLLVTGTMLVAMLMTGVAQAQSILDQMPSDAAGALVVKNIGQTNAAFGELANRLGLAKMEPMLADPLGALTQQLNVKQGLDMAGDLGLVVGGQDVPVPERMLALVPVTDYQAFLKNFPALKTEGDVSSFTGANDNTTMYVANWGKFAALTSNKALLGQKPDGLKLPPVSAKEYKSKDALLYVNMAQLGPKYLPQVVESKGMALGMVELSATMSGNAKPKDVALIKAFASRAFAGVEQYMQDAQSAVLGLKITKDGVGLSLLSEFKPASPIGKWVGGLKNTNAPLLVGLPDTDYLFYGGMTIDKASINAFCDALFPPMLAEAKQGGADVKPLEDNIELMKSALDSVQSESFGLYVPTGQLGAAPLIQGVAVVQGDTQALLDVVKKGKAVMEEAMKANGAAQVKVTDTPNAKTIDGVSLNEMKVEFQLDAKTPQEMQVAQMVKMLYGGDGMTIYYGAVDAKHMISGLGGTEENLKAAIAAAKAGETPLAKKPQFVEVARNLPENRLAVIYVSLDKVVSTVMGFAMQAAGLGAGPAPAAPEAEALPPVGISIGGDQTALRYDVYIPAAQAKTVINTVMQAMQRVGGPGMPPAPPAPGQNPGRSGGL